MITNVYIDGFNLYYGCFRDPSRTDLRRYKWLDLSAFSQALVPGSTIHRIKYFTARVSDTPRDPDQSVRQLAYLDALRTIPRLQVIEGTYRRRTKWGALAGRSGSPQVVQVEVNEEKGSDVNLAVHLVSDAYEADFEQAIVISNDSDLAGAIRIARTRPQPRPQILLFSPHQRVTRDLQRAVGGGHATVLDKSLLSRCQFPTTVIAADGAKITRPRTW